MTEVANAPAGEQMITLTLSAMEFHYIAAAVQGEVLPWKIAHPIICRLQEMGAAKAAELAGPTAPPPDAPPAA